MKQLKPLVSLMLICKCITLHAQDNTTPQWLNMHFSNKVSLQTALIKIDNKDATYADLFNVADTGLLKVEVWSKKAAQQIVGKEEGRNGLVLVTHHKKHFPVPAVKKDSAIYVIENGDTSFCKQAHPAMLGDTTNAEWIQFLQHALHAQVPADNGAPAGLYNVDITFLVNKDGTVSNVEVLEDPGYGTAAEVRHLMASSPPWTPAMCDDKLVVYRQKERIVFAVSEE